MPFWKENRANSIKRKGCQPPGSSWSDRDQFPWRNGCFGSRLHGIWPHWSPPPQSPPSGSIPQIPRFSQPGAGNPIKRDCIFSFVYEGRHCYFSPSLPKGLKDQEGSYFRLGEEDEWQDNDPTSDAFNKASDYVVKRTQRCVVLLQDNRWNEWQT